MIPLQKNLTCVLLFVLVLSSLQVRYYYSDIAFAQQEEGTDVRVSKGEVRPDIKDSNLKVEIVVEELDLPTSMAFLGSDDILVLEKEKGTVQRIVNGVMSEEPLLDLNVATQEERGMLGIAVSNNEDSRLANTTFTTDTADTTATSTYVFLYYTESEEDANDYCPNTVYCKPGSEPLGNRLYRYELVNNQLVNPKLLLDLPGVPGPLHNGGVITISPNDNNLYLTIGDVRLEDVQKKDASSLDGRSGILRITQDGEAVVSNEGYGNSSILGNTAPLNKYYAYGIRNSFGIDFDPVKGNLWDTENGAKFGDEINLVEPGFNSGWNKVQGIWDRKIGPSDSGKKSNSGSIKLNLEDNLLDFDGRGKYSKPEFIWLDTVGPTALKFLDSDKLGNQYENDMFVGDTHNGILYHFDLNDEDEDGKDRTQLLLNGPLADKIADNEEELEGIIFGEDFGGITDIEVGPDGYLYVVSIGQGKIFRIVPSTPERG